MSLATSKPRPRRRRRRAPPSRCCSSPTRRSPKLRSLVEGFLVRAAGRTCATMAARQVALCHDGRVLNDDDDAARRMISQGRAPAIASLATGPTSWMAPTSAAAARPTPPTPPTPRAATPPPRAPRASTPPADAAPHLLRRRVREWRGHGLISPRVQGAGSMPSSGPRHEQERLARARQTRAPSSSATSCKPATSWSAPHARRGAARRARRSRAVPRARHRRRAALGAAAVAAAQLCGIETPLYYFYRLVQFHPQFVAYALAERVRRVVGAGARRDVGRRCASARSAARSSSPPAASASRCTRRTG